MFLVGCFLSKCRKKMEYFDRSRSEVMINFICCGSLMTFSTNCCNSHFVNIIDLVFLSFIENYENYFKKDLSNVNINNRNGKSGQNVVYFK